MRPESVAFGQRLLVEDVEDRGGEPARIERREHRRILDQAAAGYIDQYRPSLMRGEELACRHAARVLVEGAGQHDDIGGGQELLQIRGRADLIGERRGLRRATNHTGGGAEGLHPSGDLLADRAEADDQPGGLRQLSRKGVICHCFLACRLRCSSIGWNTAQHLAQHVLGDRHALGAAVADARAFARQRLIERVVEPGIERLQDADRFAAQDEVEGPVAEAVGIDVVD